MDTLLMLPLLIPLFTAVLTLLPHSRAQWQRIAGGAGAAGLFTAGLILFAVVWRQGPQVTQIGSWAAPFGITLIADLLSATLVLLSGLVGLVVAVYSLATIDPGRESFGYTPLLHILLMGVCGAFLTGDIFNLYVWFEVMLVASFALLQLGGERAQLEATIKYLAINLVASTFFLSAVAILYGVAGTLNMAHLARVLSRTEPSALIPALAMLLFLAFGIKAAVFPLFFWLPASYHTPPAAVSAIFAGLLTKVGVYGLIRIFPLLFLESVPHLRTLLLAVSGLTMITGVLGALVQTDLRRMLSFLLISQIGTMLVGLGLLTPLGLTGSVFDLIQDIVAITSLFLASGIVFHLQGSYALGELGGLYRSHPLLAGLFLISGFSLAGMPPFSGFWAKLILIRAAFESKQFLIAAVILTTGLLTLLAIGRIWSAVFWGEAPKGGEAGWETGRSAPLLLTTGVLSLIVLLIGCYAEPVVELALRTAEQLTHPAAYIRAVLR